MNSFKHGKGEPPEGRRGASPAFSGLALLIETSTERGALFVFSQGSLLSELYLPPGLHTSVDLMPTLEALLKSIDCKPEAIDLIGVSAGPGSYTGMRVGAMAAMTLSYALHIPLVGLCSLDCFRSREPGICAVVIDARMGGVYLQLPGEDPLVCSLEVLPQRLGRIRQLLTPNKKSIAPKLATLHPQEEWVWEEAAPCPHSMYALTCARFARDQSTVNGHLDLLYMRKTQAEIEKEEKNKRNA